MSETFEQLVARVNRAGFLPPPEPTGAMTMAKPIKLTKGREFHFPTKGTGGGGAAKYPWDEWFNGSLLLLERSDVDANDDLLPGGEKRDYEVPTNAMPPKIQTAARRRYKIVQISRRDADGQPLKDALIIRARDMDDVERQAEDLKRTEEKEARKGSASDNGTPDNTAASAAVSQS